MKVIPHIFEECIALILSGSPITKELRADEVCARFLSHLPSMSSDEPTSENHILYFHYY